MNVIRYTPGPDEWAHHLDGDSFHRRLAAVAEEYRSAQPRIW